MPADPDLLARVALALTVPADDTATYKDVLARGPAAVWADLAGWFPDLDPAVALAGHTADGWRLVRPGDTEWPTRLGDLDSPRDPAAAGPMTRPGSPLVLWVHGAGHLARDTAHGVTIVGTNAPTGYGRLVAHDLAVDLAGRGHAVVAVGGYGIGEVALRAAVHASAPPVAVLVAEADLGTPPDAAGGR
jgi:DNA processing protein